MQKFGGNEHAVTRVIIQIRFLNFMAGYFDSLFFFNCLIVVSWRGAMADYKKELERWEWWPAGGVLVGSIPQSGAHALTAYSRGGPASESIFGL